MAENRTDFHISFTSVDSESAVWIANQLRQHKYTSYSAVGDPDSPGSRTLSEALAAADFVIVVLTSEYLSSAWAGPAWDAVRGSEDRLIPVRVRSFQSASHLAEGRYIDLVGLDSKDAGRKLMDQIRNRMQEYRRHQFSGLVNDSSAMTTNVSEPKLVSDKWTIADHLGFQIYVDAITEFILHPQTRPPFTVGINGKWGSGKTSLMRMIQEQFDPTDALTGRRGEIRLTDRSRFLLSKSTSNRSRVKIFPIGHWRKRNSASRKPQEHVTLGEAVERAEEPAEEKDRRLQDLQVEPPDVNVGQFYHGNRWRPTIWFNPWVCQTEEQVWAGLAYAIISQITDRMSLIERERFWLALNLSRIDTSEIRNRVTRLLITRLVPLGLSLIALLILSLGVLIAGAALVAGLVASGGALTVTFGSAWIWRRLLQTDASTTFQSLLREPDYPWVHLLESASSSASAILPVFRPNPDYQARLGFFHLVQEDIRRVLDLVSTDSRPVIIFIDDLDRCSPSVVTRVIEAISLFVAGAFPNSIFVMAMEPEVVVSHIETMYLSGAQSPQGGKTWEPESSGWIFLEKIVQLPLSMPTHPDPDLVKTYVDSLLSDSPANANKVQSATLENAAANLEAASRIADEIRRVNPRPDEIRQLAHTIRQKFLLPESIINDPLTIRAIRQVFAEMFDENREEVRDAISAGVRWMGTGNPRQIKRFVNLFRFYAFVATEYGLRNKSSLELLQTAKLAALATRWPHLLEFLGSNANDGNTWLTWLENHSSSDLSDLIEDMNSGEDGNLSKITDHSQFGVIGELRQFLKKDDVKIGSAARYLI